MCAGAQGQAVPCGEYDHNFLSLCEQETDRRLEAIYEAHPILRDWTPSPGLPACCQRDEIADASDWGAAWAWDTIRFLKGVDA